MCALAPAIDWDARFVLPGLATGALVRRGDDVMVGIAPLPSSLVDSMEVHRVLGAPFRLDAPLHIIHGELDTEAPVSATEQFVREAFGAPCTLERLPSDDHSAAKLGSKASQFSLERWLYHRLVEDGASR
jgi:hypothetical protein